jgi:hypothetical protein
VPAVFPKPGPAGPPGPEDAGFTFTQSVPSSNFTITHNLNRTTVDVSAYDTSGREVMVGVTVVDANNVQITTETGLPFTGTVLVQ